MLAFWLRQEVKRTSIEVFCYSSSYSSTNPQGNCTATSQPGTTAKRMTAKSNFSQKDFGKGTVKLVMLNSYGKKKKAEIFSCVSP